MFGSMLHRLLRRPWSLALVAGLVVLLAAAYFLAGNGQDLFGLVVPIPRPTPTSIPR